MKSESNASALNNLCAYDYIENLQIDACLEVDSDR